MTGSTAVHVAPDTAPEEIEAIAVRDGAVVIDRLITPAFCDRILDELMPWTDRVNMADSEWLGRRTRRLNGLSPKSGAIRGNVCNPTARRPPDLSSVPRRSDAPDPTPGSGALRDLACTR